jgi:hypothetical protein
VIEVRIRHEDDLKAVHLADVPFDELGTVIPTLSEWGVNGEDVFISGQFAYDPTHGAYFEVLIHETE